MLKMYLVLKVIVDMRESPAEQPFRIQPRIPTLEGEVWKSYPTLALVPGLRWRRLE